jgi:D-alanyl-lipoteichoic acid acyltransferase DltB (MBOAT superfamily)
MGVLAFSGQIFFDFAGYSTCAIGIAACLGFRLPDNFLYPYAAVGFSDFWRRWHITLSSWLRDYLYIPLGGNRVKVSRVYINLMITMLLGGLWHGANWTFVAWGALHGLYLCVEKVYREKFMNKRIAVESSVEAPRVVNAAVFQGFFKLIRSSNILLALITFFCINVTWVFFRAEDFTTAWRMLTSMFTNVKGGAEILTTLSIIKVSVIVVCMVGCHWIMRNTKVLTVTGKMPWWLVGVAWSFMLICLVLSQESSSSFIYFQF